MKPTSSLTLAASLLLSLLLASGCSTQPVSAGAASASASSGPSVAFVEPRDGATVTSPFTVKFGVTGMQVQPAGTFAPDTGHHHLLVNAEDIPSMGTIPADATHLHFGKAQTETVLTLPPGKYKLTMQFGNGYHQAYGPAMNKSINVTVQ